MTTAVTEIVNLIRSNPRTFKPQESRFKDLTGINNGVYSITGYGNTKMLSCITLKINGAELATTYLDRWKLESAIIWWYDTCPRQALEDTIKFKQQNTEGYL